MRIRNVRMLAARCKFVIFRYSDKECFIGGGAKEKRGSRKNNGRK